MSNTLDYGEALRLAHAKQSFNSDDTRKVSIITEGKRLAELGREPMLYLNFVLITFLYLLALCCTHAPHLYFFYVSEDSESNVFWRLSMANWDQTSSGPANLVIAILEVVSCVITIAYIRFMYWYINRANDQGNLLSVGDFAIHIRGVPKTEITYGVTRIVNYFSTFGKVVSCAMALDTGDINKLKDKKAFNEKIVSRCDVRLSNAGCISGLYLKLKRLYYGLRIRVIEKDLNYHLAKQQYQCTGDVFLVFSTEMERYKCLHAFNKPLCQRMFTTGGAKFSSKRLNVEPAMEPEDIIWENLEYSFLSKYTRRAVSVATTIIFMIIVTAISGILEYVRNKYFACSSCGVSDIVKSKDLKKNVAWASYGISMVVTLASSIQGYILFYLCKFEKHRFTSHMKRSLLYKLSFASFLVTIAMAVVYLKFDEDQKKGLIPFFVLINGYKSLSPLREGQLFYYNIFNVVIVKVALNLAKEFLLPWFHWIKRWYRARNSKTQDELNEAYTPPKYSFPYRYANQLRVIVLALAFGGLFPLALYIVAAGLLVSYLIDKFNVIYVYQSGFAEEDILSVSAVNVMTVAFLFRYILLGITHIYRLLSAQTSLLNFFVISWIVSTALYILFMILQFSILGGRGLLRSCFCCSSYRFPNFVTPHGKMSCTGFHLSRYEPPISHNEVRHVYASKKHMKMQKQAPPPRQQDKGGKLMRPIANVQQVV